MAGIIKRTDTVIDPSYVGERQLEHYGLVVQESRTTPDCVLVLWGHLTDQPRKEWVSVADLAVADLDQSDK